MFEISGCRFRLTENEDYVSDTSEGLPITHKLSSCLTYELIRKYQQLDGIYRKP